MRVADLMQTDVRTINRDQPLREAVVELADAHVTALAVLDNAGHLKGVISTADILEAQAEQEEEGAWEERLVSDVMSAPAVTIAPDATAKEAAQMMLYRDVHRIFVGDGETLVGVISQTDLVRALGAKKL